MRKGNDIQLNNEEERQENTSQSAKLKLRTSISSKRKLNFNHKFHQYPRNSSFSSSSLATSYMKANSLSESDLPIHKHFDFSSLNMAHFTQKYLPRGAPPDQINDQMGMVLERKDNQIEALRIYRDELKFISFNNPYYTPIRLSLRSLRGKAIVEREINNQRQKIDKELREFQLQNEAIVQYTHMISEKIKQSQGEILDMEKEELLMIENLEMETAHLIKELAEEKRKNAKEIRQIQDQILDLRVIIKQKQDKLRDLKAKICTMYIKLHSRNSSRTGSKSKERNMSLSVRKFNNQNHQTIREAFIGNNSFKNYSRQVIEKVTSDDELTRIRFIFQNRESLIFQCIYKNSEGQLHMNTSGFRNPDNQTTRDKISQQNQSVQEIYTKHLFSMKFFYKAKIVGVECRVKTEKGTKTIQLGNCDPHIEHELLTLVNKRMVTLGSYWHGKQMIGISVWYSDRLIGQGANMAKIKSSKKIELKKPKQTYEEYYT